MSRKQTNIILCLAIMTTLSLAGQETEENQDVEHDSSATHTLSWTNVFDSAYIWHGYRNWDENLWSQLDAYSQVATYLGAYFLSGTGSFRGLNKFEEFGALAYAYYTRGNNTYSGGLFYSKRYEGLYEGIDYNFEVERSFGEKHKAALNFIYNHSWDLNIDGWLIEARANKTVPIHNKLHIDLSARLTYSLDYFGANGWNAAILRANVPYQLTEKTILTPYVAQSIALDGLRDNGEENHSFYGVAIVHFF